MQGENAVAATDNNSDGTPDYVERVAQALEESRDISINRFGWAEPPSDGNWGGNSLYDVYLENLAEQGLGGYVDGGQPEAIVGDNPRTPNIVETRSGISFMGLDKSYQEEGISDAEALVDLKTTAAHEYMHSIQFGYDAVEPADWLWESTANWMMEEVYQSDNAGHSELHNAYDSPDKAPHGKNTDWYARWIFFRYISEQYGHNAVKAVWEAARSQDGYSAIETALNSVGTNLDDVMRGYTLTLLTNGFAEDAEYPTIRLEGSVTDRFQPADGVESMGADYVEIQGAGSLNVQLEATGLEGRLVGINNGQANVYPMTGGQATIDRGAYQHVYLIVQNLNRPTTGTEVNSMGYTVTVTPGGAANAPASTVDASKFQAPLVAERSESHESEDEPWGDDEDEDEGDGEWEYEGAWDEGTDDSDEGWEGETDGSEEDWEDGDWEDGDWEDGDWEDENSSDDPDETTSIEAPASLTSKQVPDGYGLIHLNMPEMNGIEATTQIRELSPHTQVVVLTSHHEDAMVFPAIKAGALSYLLKSATPDEVIDAVQAAGRREARLHPRIAQRLMSEVSGAQPSLNALTERELEVLKEIATGKDNQTIAQDLNVSIKTVKTHVSNILSKLYLQDRTQAAVYALRQRIVPLDDD